MGLRNYWIWFVALQFVLQSFILLVLLLAAARRRGDYQTRPIVLKVLVITLATVLLQSWLVWSVGWVVVIPLLGVTVLVLMDASWGALWSACAAVSVCGLFFALLTLDYSELTPDHMEQLRAKRDARKAAAVARYQHLAGDIDKIAPHQDDEGAVPGEAEDEPDETIAPSREADPADAAASAPALNLESRLPLADRLIAQGITPQQPAPPPDEAAERNWRIARSLVHYRGSVGSPRGKQVFLINGRLYDKHDTLKIVCDGTIYRWFIVGGDTNNLELKRLDTRSRE